MGPELTARDIAKFIRRPGEPLSAANDRFRNWTKMGVFRPLGERHPGRGRHKRYTQSALLDAVLLQTLVDTFGAQATGARSLLEQASKMVRHCIAMGDLDQFLVLSRDPKAIAVATVKPKDLSKYIFESKIGGHMVMNIRHLFEREHLAGVEAGFWPRRPDVKAP